MQIFQWFRHFINASFTLMKENRLLITPMEFDACPLQLQTTNNLKHGQWSIV